MRALLALLCILSLPLAATLARADEVTEQIDEALTAYRNRDIAAALKALEAATNLMRQTRADAFKTLLPIPLPGWEVEETDVNVVSAIVMGGGITASRAYRRDQARVSVEIFADSPIVQGMAAIFTAPLLALGGARQLVIDGRRMVYMKDDNAFLALVSDRALVKVSANPEVSEEILRAHIVAVDFAKLEKLVQR